MPRTLDPVLVGRRSECDRIDCVLADARSGASGTLVLRGEAGIGKSALLGYGRDRATGFTQLAVHGVESEAALAYAGLTELLRPVQDELDALPPAQNEALLSALAQHTEPANLLAVRVAVLTLLAHLAESAPVLVTIDDAQWVDESSIEALAFAARRLAAERVAVLAAARGEEPIVLGSGSGVEHVVTGLDDVDARALLSHRSGLPSRAADDLVRASAGNPLALLELPEVAGSVPHAGEVQPLPVGPRVRHAFEARLAQLPEPTRLAVGVVAAGDAGLRETLAAFATLGLEADALAPAEHDRARDRRRRPGRTAPPAACARLRITRSRHRRVATSMPRSPPRWRGPATSSAGRGTGRRRLSARTSRSRSRSRTSPAVPSVAARCPRPPTASCARPGSAPMTTPERAG